MEPEQEHLSKLYSGSGIHSLPELNPKLSFISEYTTFPPQIVYFTLPVSSSPVNGEFDDLEAYSFGIHVSSGANITKSASAPS